MSLRSSSSVRSSSEPVFGVKGGTTGGLRIALGALTTITVLCVPVLAGASTAVATSSSSCDSWTGGSGMWSDASGWSDGVPGPSTDVCINAPGTYTVTVEDLQVANSITLGGSSGRQTLVVVGNTSVESELTITSSSTVNANGILEVSSTGGGSSYLRDSTIVNDGTFEAIGSGSVTPDQIYTGLTNEKGATVDIDDDSEFPLNGSVVTNSGTFNVSKGVTMLLDGPDTFTQSGGTLDVAGTLQTATGDVFIENGGSAIGNPVNITNTTLKDSKGTGTFDLEGDGAGLSGTVPRGQTLFVLGTPDDEETSLVSRVLNDGTIVVTSPSGNFAALAGAPLVNAGRLDVEGTGQDQLRCDVTNDAGGTLDLTTLAPTQIAGALTNEGTFLLGPGAQAALDGGSVSLRASSTTKVTVAAKGGGPEITGSGPLSLGGTLEVTAVGALKVGHNYGIISHATPTGRFGKLDFPKASFRITYSPTAVTLTVAPPRNP